MFLRGTICAFLSFSAELLVAAIGGVILYRTLFVEPPAGYIITETHVRELPDTVKLIAGSFLLLARSIGSRFSRSNALNKSGTHDCFCERTSHLPA